MGNINISIVCLRAEYLGTEWKECYIHAPILLHGVMLSWGRSSHLPYQYSLKNIHVYWIHHIRRQTTSMSDLEHNSVCRHFTPRTLPNMVQISSVTSRLLQPHSTTEDRRLSYQELTPSVAWVIMFHSHKDNSLLMYFPRITWSTSIQISVLNYKLWIASLGGARTLCLSGNVVVIDLSQQFPHCFEVHASRYEPICWNSSRIMNLQVWPQVAVGVVFFCHT
jgi:hypothetical protein